MAADLDTAYDLLLARLDRAGVIVPDVQAAYYRQRLDSAARKLAAKGIVLQDDARDSTLIADLAAWHIQNRDKATGDPAWLRFEIRERWLQCGRKENGDAP